MAHRPYQVNYKFDFLLTEYLIKPVLQMYKKTIATTRSYGIGCNVLKLLVMFKLTLLALMLTMSQAGAEVFAQRATLRVTNMSLADVFNEIRRQTGYHFLYVKEDLALAKPVSVNVENATLEQVLNHCLRNQPLTYEIRKNRILIEKKKVTTDATTKDTERLDIQQREITGRVVDENGQPLSGVTVKAKGGTAATTTGDDGRYRILLSPDIRSLIFSMVGYEEKETAIGANAVQDVSLSASVSGLDEVVVVGYGVQKKLNLTGAISTVEFGAELENRPITNASQALGGTASGIWVSQNSGKPGSDGAQLRIRGWGTLNNANPLVIVDGVEGNFDQINPNDIESISVLKDAASAAIYGSKAANGVVLVTTKKGRSGRDTEISVNSYYGIQSLGRRYDVITNSAEHMELTNLALANDGSSPLFSTELVEAFKRGGDPYKYPNTDWFETLFETAGIQEHNVSVLGGTAQTSSFFSFNYLNQGGIVPNTKSQRYGMRMNVESNVNNWLTLGGRVNYLKKDAREPYSDITYGSLGRVFEMLGGAVPYIAPYTRDGRFGSVEAFDADGNMLYDNRNPLIDAANGATNTSNHILTLNVNVNMKLNDDWSWNTTFASNGNWQLVDKFNTSVFGYSDSGIETTTRNYNREGLEINRTQVSTLNNNLFSTLNFSREFAGDHYLSGIAGLQLEANKIQDIFARRSSPPKEGLTQVDAGTSGIQNAGNMTTLRIFSYFGRINYDFRGKYLFEANLRADASSRFREGRRWGVFPGFSAGWRLSDERFIQDMDLFSNLKLRASWGQLGNQNIEGYWPYLTVITQNNDLSYSYNGAFAPGAAVTGLVDRNITWETTSTLDIGMDIGLLNNKINIEADYFTKKTSDIIVQLPIPLVLGGITAPFENVGEMVNNGFEFILNYDNRKLDRRELGMNFGVNLTYIDNKVTKFRGGKSPDQLYLIREGYSFRTLYGFKAVGIYQSDEEAAAHMHSNSFVPKAGNLKFEDLNQDGRLTFEDKQALGNTIPRFTFGFSPRFRYGGFDLNLLFQGIVGVNVYTQNYFTNMSGDNRAFSTKWRNSWTPNRTGTDVPSIRFDNSWDASESSYWVDQLDFLKLKNVQLGYDFPKHIVSKLGIDKLYLYANAQNVFTWVTNEYEGYDPERNTFDSGANLYPVPRILSFGVNLKF